MTSTEEQILLTFKRKILRTIFGPVLDQVQDRWRKRFNHDLMELYQLDGLDEKNYCGQNLKAKEALEDQKPDGWIQRLPI